MTSSKPLDEATLLNLKELLEDNFEMLVKTFVSDGNERIERLGKGIDSKDMDVIRLESHALKGSASNLGATPFAKICEKLENQARANDDTDIESQFSTIKHDFGPLCRLIESHL